MVRSDFDSSELAVPLQAAPVISLRALEHGGSVDGLDHVDLRSPGSLWRLALSMLRRRHGHAATELSKFLGDEKHRTLPTRTRPSRWLKRPSRWLKGSAICAVLAVLAVLVLLTLVLFGIVHMVNVSMSLAPVFLDSLSSPLLPSWSQSHPSTYPTDLTQGVIPINCHSHNDYWRRIPLYEALRYGCTGVEADVWLFDDDLFVGHDTKSLTPNRTFRSMYVDPIAHLLDEQNASNNLSTTSTTSPSSSSSSSSPKRGLFTTNPAQTVVLLVDFKTSGPATFPILSAQLATLRQKNYLTYSNGTTTIPGPITIVATGNAPFNLITANQTYRDIFFDAPLSTMYQPAPSSSSSSSPLTPHPAPPPPPPKLSGQGTIGVTPTSTFDATNSFYASVSFRQSIGWLWFGRLSATQLDLIRGQIRGARQRGLKPRYWDTPEWPVATRNKVWKVLVDEGVEYLNGDDLEGMTRGDWGRGRHGGWM